MASKDVTSGAAATDTNGKLGESVSATPWLMFQANLETRTPVETHVTGTIPEWLTGVLYRNGCGLFEEGEDGSSHLFQGYAVLHRFTIQQQKVKYTSRVVDREAWMRAVKAKRTAVGENGEIAEYPDPCRTTFAGTSTYFKESEALSESEEVPEDVDDKTGVNIVRHGDKLFALTESCVLQEIHPDTLSRTSIGCRHHPGMADRRLVSQMYEMVVLLFVRSSPVQQIDVRKVFSLHMATAHPHFGKDGTLYNLATSFAPPDNYNIIKIPPHALGSDEDMVKHMKLVASVQSRWNFGISYSHSFGMCDKYFVILEQPATLSTMKILGHSSSFTPSSVFKNFDLHPDEKIRFYLISRRQGNTLLPLQFLANACFTFHFVNCYEDGDFLVVDLASYDNINIINELCVSNVTTNRGDVATAVLRRYVLPLNVDKMPLGHNLSTLPYTKARARVLSSNVVHLTPDYIGKSEEKIYIELPRINQNFSGRKYQFAYGTSLFTRHHRLIKLDLNTGTPVYWEMEGFDPGEPVFVPRHDAAAEDDGVVLSPVISLTGREPSFLLLLDAHTFKEVARATIPQEVRVALSFHGNFYSEIH